MSCKTPQRKHARLQKVLRYSFFPYDRFSGGLLAFMILFALCVHRGYTIPRAANVEVLSPVPYSTRDRSVRSALFDGPQEVQLFSSSFCMHASCLCVFCVSLGVRPVGYGVPASHRFLAWIPLNGSSSAVHVSCFVHFYAHAGRLQCARFIPMKAVSIACHGNEKASEGVTVC